MCNKEARAVKLKVNFVLHFRSSRILERPITDKYFYYEMFVEDIEVNEVIYGMKFE